jgi:RimJ/RimL family protein N-acetyltransferase
MDANLYKGDLVRLAVLDPEKDAKFMVEANLDSEFSRMLDSDPVQIRNVKATQEWIEQHSARSCSFMIYTLEGDRKIGFVDLMGIDPVSQNAWIGIGIGDRDYWGKGYGSEAMRLAMRYGFEELNLHRISLNVFEYNTRALGSYLKVGFKGEGRSRKWLNRAGKRWDVIYMGILRSEWEARSQ